MGDATCMMKEEEEGNGKADPLFAGMDGMAVCNNRHQSAGLLSPPGKRCRQIYRPGEHVGMAFEIFCRLASLPVKYHTIKRPPPPGDRSGRESLSLISHVDDTQVLEKRRYVDRSSAGEREGVRARPRRREEEEESIALPRLHHKAGGHCRPGRQSGRCMLSATGSLSVRRSAGLRGALQRSPAIHSATGWRLQVGGYLQHELLRVFREPPKQTIKRNQYPSLRARPPCALCTRAHACAHGTPMRELLL